MFQCWKVFRFRLLHFAMIYRFMWEEKSSLLCSENTDSGREYRYEHLSFVCAQNMQSWKKVQNNLFGTLVLQDELLCFVENQRGIIRNQNFLSDEGCEITSIRIV